MPPEPNGMNPSADPAKLSGMRPRLVALLLALALVSTGVAAAWSSASPAASCKTRVYRVRAGDTLFSIAQRFGTTIKAIARANRLNPNGILRIGVQLGIPASGCGGPATSKPQTVAVPLAPARISAASLTRALRVQHLPLR